MTAGGKSPDKSRPNAAAANRSPPPAPAPAPPSTIADPDTHALWRGVADQLRPPADLSPSQFALAHRVLHASYCPERPGPWTFDKFPYGRAVLDMFQEAVETEKAGLVIMGAGQCSKTDLALCGQLWLKKYFPGPQAFITTTQTVAEEFDRKRFKPVIRDCLPLAAMKIDGDKLCVNRFADGDILLGGMSLNNFLSTSFKVVVLDEVDSLADDLEGAGDPIELAKIRTNSFLRSLLVAYAHPTTRDRASGRLFHTESDMRYPHVRHQCGHWFVFDWNNIQADDTSDAATYYWKCPGCKERITDAQRIVMVRGVEFRSVLPPEVAARRRWIGVQFGQLIVQHKSVAQTAQTWLDCQKKGVEGLRVFWNKVIGIDYEPEVKSVDASALRGLACVKRFDADPEFYRRGQVPPGVRFLTAGQDTRLSQLHWCVWGWGLRKSVSGQKVLCGWLIDWGEIERAHRIEFDESEWDIFDRQMYGRDFPSADGKKVFRVKQGAHDIGYSPPKIPILRYCRRWPGRAFPCHGAALNEDSASKADPVHWGSPITYQVDDVARTDEEAKPLIVNTFAVKCDFYAMIQSRIDLPGPRKVSRLTVPADVDDLWLGQTSNEYLAHGDRGRMVWKHRGPNHLADCNTYASALALNLESFLDGQTDEEVAIAEASDRLRKQNLAENPPDDPFIASRTPPGRPSNKPWIARR